MSIQDRDVQNKRFKELHKKIRFYGTPENDYMDSGLWEYLKYIRTKDEHDAVNPIKPLPMDDGKTREYILHVFHQILRNEQIFLPKSRQIMMSWMMAIFCTWFARTAPHRLIMWQSEKEDKAAKMVSMGRDDELTARMSFIEFNLTNPDGTFASWLADPKIISKKGMGYCKLIYKNGSNIMGIPQGGSQVRQEVPSLFCSDESAFQAEFRAAYEAAQPCVDGGGKAIYVTTAAPSYFGEVISKYPGHEKGEDPPPKAFTDQFEENKYLPKGMIFYKTKFNIPVLRVHYTADPTKDPERQGAAWYKRLSDKYGGPDDPGWLRELEIDWTVSGGTAVFPMCTDNPCPALIPSIDPDIAMADMNIIAGFDYGLTDSSCLEVTGIDKYGVPFNLWEWWESYSAYPNTARAIKESPYWPVIKDIIVADNSIWDENQNTKRGPMSIAQLLAEEGVTFRKGHKGSPSADVRVARRYRDDFWFDINNPKAFVTMSCPKVWESVQKMRWEEHKTVQAAEDKKPILKIKHKFVDAWDAHSQAMDKDYVAYVGPTLAQKTGTYRYVRDQAKRAKKQSRWDDLLIGAQ